MNDDVVISIVVCSIRCGLLTWWYYKYQGRRLSTIRPFNCNNGRRRGEGADKESRLRSCERPTRRLLVDVEPMLFHLTET